MAINIEEKIELETWELLKQLKADICLTLEDQYVTYEVIEYRNKKYPDLDNQRKIIYKLENLGILKIHKKNFFGTRTSFMEVASMVAEYQGAKPLGFLLNIDKDKFKEIFNEYEKKYSKDDPVEIESVKVHIEKKDDDFYYSGKLLNISKNNDPYKVFSSLYALLPRGGEIGYEDLGKEVKSRIQKTKNYDDKKMNRFIQNNLTDKSNGFMRYAKIPNTENNGKPLIYTKRSEGLYFNNKIE